MIDRIVIENFKSLRKVDLPLGRLNLFIGANASGKSNFLDALRVLQGIGNGFTIGEILDGKARSATSEVWDGIRGGTGNACFAGGRRDRRPGIRNVGWSSDSRGARGSARRGRRSLGVLDRVFARCRTGGGRTAQCRNGRLRLGLRPRLERVFAPGRPRSRGAVLSEGIGGSGCRDLRACATVLGQVAGGGLWDTVSLSTLTRVDDVKWQTDRASRMAALLASVQCLDPIPARLRNYAADARARRMGEHGENFAALVELLCGEDETRKAYLSWLQELRPEEVSNVGVLHGAVKEPLFKLHEGDREVPAPVLSDGTFAVRGVGRRLLSTRPAAGHDDRGH